MKIFTAQDRAEELGFTSYFALLEKITGLKIENRETANGQPVKARVDCGRWLADCECGGASYVDIGGNFFCTSCQNKEHGGKLRRVVFPNNHKEIEAELLLRYSPKVAGMFGTQEAMNAALIEPCIPRSWNAGESVTELKRQRADFEKYRNDELKKLEVKNGI